MTYPAAVSAATVAGLLLLAFLAPGLSLPAEDISHCLHCFYRQTPPQLASTEAPQGPLCHGVPGQAFATLYNPNCDTAVCSAFCLSHGWTEGGGEDGGTLATEKAENDIKVLTPALLQRAGHSSHTDSPLQLWDSTFTALVRSSILPQCGSAGGDLYILTGTGKLGGEQDGDEECKARLFWSAGCCAVSTGEPGFSVGLVRDSEEGMRVVSVDELEELVGVVELFSEGCGGTEKQVGENMAAHLREAFEHIETLDSDKTMDENIGERREAPVAADRVASLEGQLEEGQVFDVRKNTFRAAEATPVTETDTESNSTLVYILSTTISILTAPLRPVVSTITHFPGQVTYVLQEDLGVLLALPRDTCFLIYLMTSDLLSWVGSGADTLLGLGEAFFSSMYYCTSSILGELLANCQTGVTGVATLAGDTVGIFGDVVDNAWSVTGFFVGLLREQSEGYVGTVVSEMGGQTKAVCTGLGKLAWRSSNGVGNVVKLCGGLIMWNLDMVINAGREAFGESQSQDHNLVNAVKEVFEESQTEEQ